MGVPRSIHESDTHSTPHSTHEADQAHGDQFADMGHDDWVEPKNLDAPEPREGMTQRWIRYADRDGDDLINYQTAMRRGWRPRPVESIPTEFRNFPTVTHAAMGECFAVAGMVLCEMPLAQYERLKAAKRRRNNTLNLAVSDETDRASRYGEARGYARIVRRERVAASRRPPNIQAD